MAIADPVPNQEAARIATLHALNILDTPPEERFDRLTRLAAELFDMPIALITLVDEARVWFKSKVGLPVRQIACEQSLCLSSIRNGGIFVIEDARRDPCFKDNPLVCGAPFLTFYAGRALDVDGHKLGNFCILDTKPRSLTDRQLAFLEDLGTMAENELRATYLSQSLAERLAELEEVNEQLALADRHKDDFLSVISHELRTPLSFIVSSASILQDGIAGPMTEEQAHFVANVMTGADRMSELVNNLLDVTKMAAGCFEVSLVPCSYRDILDEAIKGIQPMAESKEIQVLCEPFEATVLADSQRMLQVLTNLLDNAIKFSKPSGEIRVASRIQGDRVVTEVIDKGIGIPPDAHERIFERFRQLDMRLERDASGVGLGLNIAKAIVEAHGGMIGVTSTPGEGSIFWFEVPLVARPISIGAESEGLARSIV